MPSQITEIPPLEPLALTVKRTCEVGGFGPTTVYALIKAGKLETTQVGRRRLVKYKSLKTLLGIEGAP
jgi:excisionase family DNA binding protein